MKQILVTKGKWREERESTRFIKCYNVGLLQLIFGGHKSVRFSQLLSAEDLTQGVCEPLKGIAPITSS